MRPGLVLSTRHDMIWVNTKHYTLSKKIYNAQWMPKALWSDNIDCSVAHCQMANRLQFRESVITLTYCIVIGWGDIKFCKASLSTLAGLMQCSCNGRFTGRMDDLKVYLALARSEMKRKQIYRFDLRTSRM